MNFDKAIIRSPDGKEKAVTPEEFLNIPLHQRIELMTASRITFYRAGAIISAMEAVRRPK